MTSSATREQSWRNFDVECLCCGKVYYHLVFGPEFDWQITGFFAFENSADVETGAAVRIRLTRPVTDQTAGLGVLALIIYRW